MDTLSLRDKRQSGFSLIEVVVSSAIMGVILLSSMQMVQNQVQAVSYLEDKLSKNDLKWQLINKLKDPVACANSFRNLRVRNTQTVTTLKQPDDSVAYATNDATKNSIDRLNLNRMDLVNVSLANAPNELGEMRLQVFPIRQRKGGGPAELAPVEISMTMETNGASRISACQAQAEGAVDGKCASLPTGITSPAAASYREGFTVSSTNRTHVCINNAWTSFDRNPASTPTTTTTTPPRPNCGARGTIWNGYRWVCRRDGR